MFPCLVSCVIIFCLDQYDSHGRLSLYSSRVVDAEQPSQPCLCVLNLCGESECCELSGHDDRRICGITCSALFCLTEEMRLILSSSVQITGRANLPINTLIHLEWCVCVRACVCVCTRCLTQRGTCCICGAHALLLTSVWNWEAVI